MGGSYISESASIYSAVKNDFVEITVKDYGFGIAQEKQKKLFRIDEQYRMEGTANEKGTVLGLILYKVFVEKSGGTISVESELNKESKFIFNVPLYNNSLE